MLNLVLAGVWVQVNLQLKLNIKKGDYRPFLLIKAATVCASRNIGFHFHKSLLLIKSAAVYTSGYLGFDFHFNLLCCLKINFADYTLPNRPPAFTLDFTFILHCSFVGGGWINLIAKLIA